MFVSYHREKLINAILYFVQNTKYCNTIKLFKLLNFLDFEHYRQTGTSVTGMRYEAWEQGPVPRTLWHEIHKPNPDFANAITVAVCRDELTDEPKRRDFVLKKRFDSKYFTKRELRIMEQLAFFFRDLTASDMSKYSHSPRMPWRKVYKGKDKPAAEIPYELTLSSDCIISDMPTIEPEELEYLRRASREIEDHVK